jgi:hypothetical protein
MRSAVALPVLRPGRRKHSVTSIAIRLGIGAVAAATVAFTNVRSSAVVPQRAVRVDSLPALARFLEGVWRCRGGTPAGKVLESDVTFGSTLDAHWVKSEHVDIPPGRYRSLALWPADTTGREVVTTIYDNFGGARRFAGSWSDDSIVWRRDTSETGARPERFTYRRTSVDTYWYAWHVRRGAGLPMTLGDSATCRRVR